MPLHDCQAQVSLRAVPQARWVAALHARSLHNSGDMSLVAPDGGTWQGPVLQLEGLLSPGTAADPST